MEESQATKAGNKDAGDADKRAEEDKNVIVDGVFSWTAAWCMMFFVLTFICSLVVMVLTYQGAGIERVSREISFIVCPNPPYGPADQPNPQRDINEPFLYHLPQVALFYSLAASSFGLFTVCYFTNFVFMEDQGNQQVVDLCSLITKGVMVYLQRAYPIVIIFLSVTGCYVLATAGMGTLVCFVSGSLLNLASCRIGLGIMLQGQSRLANLMGHTMSESLKMGIRSGACGGILAASLALGGMSLGWLMILDTKNLSGFASGSAIVSFYIRVGGGIFSKGSELGGDLVGDMDDRKADEERRVFELQRRMAELDEKRKELERNGKGDDDDANEDMLDQLRLMEEEMQDSSSLVSPIEYMEPVGDMICDAAGSAVDLFESMVLILSTSAIIGARGSPVPHFQSGLPFWIAASGNIGCAVVAYRVHGQERFTSFQIRWALRVSLICVILFVEVVVAAVCYLEVRAGMMDLTQFWHYLVIVLMGQFIPEICVMFGEFFTSMDYSPVRSIAQNSHLGIVQVVMQGLGQGFLSTGFPAASLVIVIMVSWELEGHYGLALLSSASLSGTAFQGGIAAFGAVASNAHRIVYLTTHHSLTRNRANILASVGATTAHAGKTLASVNAFTAVFNVAVTLLAQMYTRLELDYGAVSGSPLNEWSQAGLVMGVVMVLLFTASTIMSCLDTSKAFVKFCKESVDAVGCDEDLPFPASHMRALATLTSFGTVTSMRMVFGPFINSLVCPMMGGFILGAKGLLFVLSGANVLILGLGVFLVNSGQSWVAARKYVLFGYLKNPEGEIVGPDSPYFQNLGVGVMIGGPFEDTTGPALNNFIKFVAVIALVTESLYDPSPERTFMYGFGSAVGSVILILMARFGLTIVLNGYTRFMRYRQQLHEEAEDEDEDDDEPLEDMADDFEEDVHVGVEEN